MRRIGWFSAFLTLASFGLTNPIGAQLQVQSGEQWDTDIGQGWPDLHQEANDH